MNRVYAHAHFIDVDDICSNTPFSKLFYISKKIIEVIIA